MTACCKSSIGQLSLCRSSGGCVGLCVCVQGDFLCLLEWERDARKLR